MVVVLVGVVGPGLPSEVNVQAFVIILTEGLCSKPWNRRNCSKSRAASDETLMNTMSHPPMSEHVILGPVPFKSVAS